MDEGYKLIHRDRNTKPFLKHQEGYSTSLIVIEIDIKLIGTSDSGQDRVRGPDITFFLRRVES